ncbi:MAG: hypothetical protein HOQ44_02525 [Nocardia sp.]|nr:hypothetical protein [Nocardia sp.]
MSDKHTPWSRSRHRPGLSADQFGSLDPRVQRTATNRPFQDRSGVAGPLESVRLLGSAAQESGDGARNADTEAAGADPAGFVPSGTPGSGEENTYAADGSRQESGVPDHAAEYGYEGYAPAGYEEYATAGHEGSAASVPDPAASAAYPAYPPFPGPETVRSGAYRQPPVDPRDPSDNAWPVPETEALELLPVGGHALLGLCIGLAVLLAVAFFYMGRTSGSNQAAAPTAATVVSTMSPSRTGDPAAESPDIGAGFAWGKVLTNDGSTLTIKSEINHSVIVVHADAHTKVYVLVATTIEAIAVGAPILVYGRKHADGSISADTITGVSLRALGSG